MFPSFRKKHGRSRFHRLVIWSLAFLTVAALAIGAFLYTAILKPNVWLGDDITRSVYIPTGSDYEDVKNILYSHGLVRGRFTFEWLAARKNYPELIKPGHYVIEQGMNNDQLINMLRAGEQTPVDVIFNTVRNIEAMARAVSQQIEADSASIVATAFDPDFLLEEGLDSANASVIYIPNTYEFWWTTDAESFRDRMVTEYHTFWNEDRLARARKLKFSVAEVVTLASIIEKETIKNDEKATIAGVYINRLKKGWRLQADPTLVYIANDLNIKRVLNIHKKIESPYNTYIHYGLPPGPICIPSVSSIEAVLNYRDHNYMFFCARADQSGYHAFATTLREHNQNARAYQRMLNEKKVMK